MVTVSHVVKKLIEEKPLVFESLSNGIASYANLAEYLLPEVQAELNQEVKVSAIVMAIRRYAETMNSMNTIKSEFKFNTEIIMKTGIVDITVVKSPSVFDKIDTIYHLVDYDKGDTLNIIQGNYEVTFVFSDRYEDEVKKTLSSEKILNTERNLVALTMSFSKDFLYTPGIISTVSRKLFWAGINVYENISTMTELTFIISKNDVMKAYKALESLVQKK